MSRYSPKISIVIPVSNMAGRLQNLESSIKSADPINFQVIVVHDFREEKTSFGLKAVINRLNKGHIELHEGKFGSAGSARNEGMIHATGKYIVFWDSDDIGYPEQIEKVIEVTDWRSISAVASSFEVVKGHSKKNHLFSRDQNKNLNSLASYPGIWRWIFLREDIQHRFTSLSMGEDQLFLVQNLQGIKFSFSDKITYRYFLGIENQSTGTFDKNKSNDLGEVFARVRKMENTGEREFQNLLSRMMISQAFTLLKYSSPREKLSYLIKIICNTKTAASLLKIRINDGF